MNLATLCFVMRCILLATAIGLIGAPPAGAQAFQALHAFYEPPIRPNQLLIAPDGTFYGTTRAGGRFGRGTLFRRAPDGSVSVLHDFSPTEGSGPYGTLIRGSDRALYGVTLGGGPGDHGTIFKWDGQLTTLHAFSYNDGSGPWGGLVQGSDGALYGTTQVGGTFGSGTLFKWDGALTTLHNFQAYTSTNGAYPIGPLVVDPDGTIYGTTSGGGSSANFGGGTIFRWKGAFAVLYRFPLVSYPTGVIKGSDGALYGTTAYGGPYPGNGAIFRWDGVLTMLHQFNYADGAAPLRGVLQGADGALYGTTSAGGAGKRGTIFRWAGSLTTLHAFDGTDGAFPNQALTLGGDGLLYGATPGEDNADGGSLFRLDTLGAAYAVLYRFRNEAPRRPLGPPVVGRDGALYGVTELGGQDGWGALYRRGTDGTLTIAHSFGIYDAPVDGLARGSGGTLYGLSNQSLYMWDGAFTPLHAFQYGEGYPAGVAVVGNDGAIYGTTAYGPGGSAGAYGTIFRWNGTFATVHNFVEADGLYPSDVTQGIDGALYGTTRYGGAAWDGTIFRWNGGLTPLYSFTEPDFPVPGIVQGADGALYGTTARGGSTYQGAIYKLQAGTLTTVHDFGGLDGALPSARMIRGSDGALYGTTGSGGAGGKGTVFRWDGRLTVLHEFSGDDGAGPGLLVQGADGALYGSTGGGPFGQGTLFRILLAPTSENECKNDGWQSRARRDGTLFKSQGDCVQYVIVGR